MSRRHEEVYPQRAGAAARSPAASASAARPNVDGYSALRAGLLLVLLTGPTLVVPLLVARVVGHVSRVNRTVDTRLQTTRVRLSWIDHAACGMCPLR